MSGFRIWNKKIDIKLKVLEMQKNKKELPGTTELIRIWEPANHVCSGVTYRYYNTLSSTGKRTLNTSYQWRRFQGHRNGEGTEVRAEPD